MVSVCALVGAEDSLVRAFKEGGDVGRGLDRARGVWLLTPTLMLLLHFLNFLFFIVFDQLPLIKDLMNMKVMNHHPNMDQKPE